jgi:hypothetical protein
LGTDGRWPADDYEIQLEELLYDDLSILEAFGHRLVVYRDPATGSVGRQLICKGNGGRIDLLCYDVGKKSFLVIELKNVEASQNTFGQIANYIGWVKMHIARGAPVKGLVISRGMDLRFESSLHAFGDTVSHINFAQLGFH